MGMAETPHITHEPPSLPSSPHHKKTKLIDPAPAAPSIASALFAESDKTTMASAQQTSMEAPPALQVQLLGPKGKAPTRGSAFAAGYDLYASKETTVPARGKVLADTDISIAVPAGTYGRVAPRSGLASKHSIDVGAGVIDADYRGPLKVLLFNFSDTDFKVAVGERVAQLIVERIYTPDVVVVPELEQTVRGAGGF